MIHMIGVHSACCEVSALQGGLSQDGYVLSP